jgi:nitrate/nitrite transporter NarK
MYTKHFFLFTDKLPNLLKPCTSKWSLNVKPVSRGQDEWFLVLFYIYTFFISYTMMTRYMVYDNHKEELTLSSCHEIFKFSWKKLAYTF